MTVEEKTDCRWCRVGVPKLVAYSAKARWIVDQSKDRTVGTLVHCANCDLLYFSDLFSSSELHNMYSGYRGLAYFQRRNRFEPWYTQKLNDAIGHSSDVLDLRREHLGNLLQKLIRAGDVIAPIRVLDVGGDEGQFIPNLPSIKNRAVLEVSGVRPIAEVASISNWEEAAVFGPDLLMICHVLEHTDLAREMIEAASGLLKPGQLLYVEVPLDRPKKIGKLFRKKAYQTYTRWLAGHPVFFRAADLISLVSRRMLGQPIWGSIIKQNEHLNYFSRESLASVVSSLGFLEVEKSLYKPSSGVPILDVEAVGILFKRT